MLLELRGTDSSQRNHLICLFSIVYAIYLVSAVIYSSVYENGKWFLASDPLSYFELLGLKQMDVDPLTQIVMCYGLFHDGNELHELFVRYCIIFSNNYLDGANVLFLTLTNVMFGVLSVAPIYRVLCKILNPNTAFRYCLAFAALSPFIMYSSLFVRDIVIAFFYAHAIEIILGRFKVRNVFLLLILALLAWGVRLYNGLFLIVFVFYYLVSPFLNKKRARIALLVIFIPLFFYSYPLIQNSVLFEQSVDEMELYQEFSQEEGGPDSFSGKLYSLPFGIKEVALVLYTQIAPFPNYMPIENAQSMGQFYMAMQIFIYELYWYFIAFGLLYMIFINGAYKQLAFNEVIFLIICFVFLLLYASHPDVRRYMCIYPLILYLYAKVRCVYLRNIGIVRMNKRLMVCYLCLLLVYWGLKFV